jgi:hypothetical protein
MMPHHSVAYLSIRNRSNLRSMKTVDMMHGESHKQWTGLSNPVTSIHMLSYAKPD